MFLYGLLYTDTLGLADQQKRTFISSEWTLDEDLTKMMPNWDGW